MLTDWTNPDFRDDSAMHQRLIVTREVPDEIVQAWENLNDRMEIAGLIPYPPPWAYVPYGRLKETPCFPGQPGFFPEPITRDDLEELKLELFYDSFRPR